MSVLLLDRDRLTGITRWFHPRSDGGFTVHTEQDVTARLETNREMRNDTPRSARWRDFERVASIPLTVYFDLKKRGIADDTKALMKWLNDPDNRAFRTREGRL